jgi:hypothetical protein
VKAASIGQPSDTTPASVSDAISSSGRTLVAVWGLVAVDLAIVVVTYSRLAPEDLYHTSHGGLPGGLGRALVEANFPAALIAVAVLLVAAPRPRIAALVAAALCLVIAVPGVLTPADLDAKPVNAVPAVGVALAFLLSLRATPARGRPRGDRLRIALAALAILAAAPWIAATLGFYLDGVPLFGWLYQTGEIVSYRGNEPHPAVHHGIHHGWQGLLLIGTALLLSRLRLSRAAEVYLSLLLAYGIANMVNDGWLEQIAERGWTGGTFPDVLQPRPNWGWLAVFAATPLIWAFWFRQPTATISPSRSST